MRLLLTILISLLCFSQLTAQQADTLTAKVADYFQGGGDVGTLKSGSLGEKCTASQKVTGQNTSLRSATRTTSVEICKITTQSTP